MTSAACWPNWSGEIVAIDAAPADLAFVLGILARFLPGREVRAFGSRVTGRAKRFSDLDLAVLGPRLPSSTLMDLQDAFRESDLPFKVDIIEWECTQPYFRKIVEEKFEVIQPAAPEVTGT